MEILEIKARIQTKTVPKITVIKLGLALIVIQFFRPDRVNTTIVQADTLEASTNVPENVHAMHAKSCWDCSSNETVYPWYSGVASFSWPPAYHISEGRREVNFSVWTRYETRRNAKKRNDICDRVESGQMPLPSYLWIPRDSGLKDGEAEILCNWAKAEKARLAQQVFR